MIAIRTLRPARQAETSGADVVIVGAGSAGGVLAARLSQDPSRSVLLLDAGADFGPISEDQPRAVADAFDSSARATYGWEHAGTATALDRSVAVHAGRIVGGSSAINSVMALRGHRDVYDGWAAAAAPDGRSTTCSRPSGASSTIGTSTTTPTARAGRSRSAGIQS